MRAALALGSLRAEASEVKRAQLAPDVLLGANGAERAEAHVVVRAGRQLGHGVDVEVQALLAVGAVAVAHEEVALGHLAQIVLVQELAGDALFAQAAQPVLAHERVEPAGRVRRRLAVRDVPLRAPRAVGAAARLVGLADGPVHGQADLVCLAQEGGEAERVGAGCVVEDGGGWAVERRRRRGRFCRHGGRACRRVRGDAFRRCAFVAATGRIGKGLSRCL